MTRLKIVHTESSCGWGGQELRIIAESQGMMSRGHEVCIVAPPESRIFSEARRRGIPAHTAPITRKSLRGLLGLRRFLAQRTIDVVNCHSSTDSWLTALALRTLPRAPRLVRTRHISSPIPGNPATRWLFRTATAHVVTTGERLREQVVRETGLEAERVSSIPTGIDLAHFAPGDRRGACARLGLPLNAFVIGIVATLRSWKGHRYLVDAVAGARDPDWRLIMVGDGPGAENLRAQGVRIRPLRVRSGAHARADGSRFQLGRSRSGNPVSNVPETERLAQAPAPDADLLVVIVARIGDTLLVTPMLRALKEASPRGTLTVLAHPKRVDVLKHLPFIDRLGTIKPKSAWLRGRLGGKRFAIAFVFGHDSPLLSYAQRLSARVVAFGDGAPARDAARCILVPRPRAPIHAVRERLMLAEAVGITVRNLRLTYVVTDAERNWAVHWLAKAFPAAGPVVGLQMVSFPTKAHRNWPAQSFAGLAERILTRHPAASFVVLGDRETEAAGEALSVRFPGRWRVAAGKLSLRESAAIIAELDLYVGVDTGPTHIAGALEVPMIGIYHHAYPGRYLAPLNRARCRVLEQPAVGELSVDEVMSEVESLFSERGHQEP